MPNAVWMSADAARAVFPLAGSRRAPWSGRIVVGRRFAFITLINTRRDTNRPPAPAGEGRVRARLDDQDFDLAIAHASL